MGKVCRIRPQDTITLQSQSKRSFLPDQGNNSIEQRLSLICGRNFGLMQQADCLLHVDCSFEARGVAKFERITKFRDSDSGQTQGQVLFMCAAEDSFSKYISTGAPKSAASREFTPQNATQDEA